MLRHALIHHCSNKAFGQDVWNEFRICNTGTCAALINMYWVYGSIRGFCFPQQTCYLYTWGLFNWWWFQLLYVNLGPCITEIITKTDLIRVKIKQIFESKNVQEIVFLWKQFESVWSKRTMEVNQMIRLFKQRKRFSTQSVFASRSIQFTLFFNLVISNRMNFSHFALQIF